MKKFAWVWALWLLFLVVSFACLEGYALYDDTTTLSRFVWSATAAFPPLPFVAGFLGGFLCCHFWWGGIVAFLPVKKDGSQ
jgi:hypothetical protein